jgi:DNA-binding PadR family transcriptional regulator
MERPKIASSTIYRIAHRLEEVGFREGNKITELGKKALEGRRALNKNERMDHESLIEICGEEVDSKGLNILWIEIPPKNNRITLPAVGPSSN